MDSSGDLACGVETGDNIALGVDYLGVGVNGNAAHGVMYAGSDERSVERTLGNIVVKTGCASESGIVLVGDSLVPGVDGLLENSGIHIEVLCKLLYGCALNENVVLNIALNSLYSLTESLVEYQICTAVGLLQFCGGNCRTGLHFVDKALAFLVDKDSAVAAQTLGYHDAGSLMNSRVNLNLLNVGQLCAYRLCHNDTVTGSAGGVGGNKALELGAILGVKLLVCAEAAGCENYRLGVEDVILILTGRLYAYYRAVVGDKLGCLGVKIYGNLLLRDISGQLFNKIRAYCAAALGTMCALCGRCRKGGQIGQGRSDRSEPVDCRRGIGCECGNKLLIVDVAAALHSVVYHQLNRVLNTGSLLHGGLGSIHAAGSLGGVAAHHSHLFDDYNVLAGSLCLDSGSHACAAGTDYGYINVYGFNRTVTGSCGSTSLILGNICAGSGDSGGNSLYYRLAGNGSARHNVNIDALSLEHICGELFNSYRAYAGGLVLSYYLDILDFVAIHGDGGGNIAAKALCGACSGSCRGSGFTGGGGGGRCRRCLGRRGSGRGRCTSCHRNDHHNAEQQCKCLFHCLVSFLLFQTFACELALLKHRRYFNILRILTQDDNPSCCTYLLKIYHFYTYIALKTLVFSN